MSVEPVEPPLVGPERAMLEGWLDYHRAILLAKCAGLDDEQRKRRPVGASLMSLHGLVRHLADVERNWFRRVLQRRPDVPALFLTEDATAADWAPLEGRLGGRSGRLAG
jgi:hypothetical protein